MIGVAQNWLRFVKRLRTQVSAVLLIKVEGPGCEVILRRFCEFGLSPTLPFRLFDLLGPLALAQAHAQTPSVFVNEFDARSFSMGASDFLCCTRAALLCPSSTDFNRAMVGFLRSNECLRQISVCDQARARHAAALILPGWSPIFGSLKTVQSFYFLWTGRQRTFNRNPINSQLTPLTTHELPR